MIGVGSPPLHLARQLAGGLLLLLTGLGAYAGPSSGRRTVDQAVGEVLAALDVAFGSTAEAMGDDTAAAEELLSALERLASRPCSSLELAAAEVLLARLGEFAQRSPLCRSTPVLEKILRTWGLTGRAKEMFIDLLAACYRASGAFGKADVLERRLGYVRRWLVCGPFGHTRFAVHSQEFPPEREIELGREERSLWRKLRWQLFEAPGTGRRVDIFAAVYPREGCAYALAQVQVQQDTDAILIVRCEGSHKVWWNGALVLDADFGSRRPRSENAIGVKLCKGWNRLLIKVTEAEPIISCRLTDPSGQPLDDLKWEDGLVLHGLPERTFETAPVDWGGWRTLAELLNGPQRLKPDQEALVRAALGILARLEHREEEELSQLEKAAELASDGRPHILFQLANTLERTSLLPPNIRRSRSFEVLSRAAASRGGFIPAEERLAIRLWRDRKPDEAISRLREALARGKRHRAEKRFSGGEGRICIRMAEMALEEGWTGEAKAFAQDAENSSPELRAVHLFWARFHVRMQNYTFAVDAYRRALRLDESDTAVRSGLARLLLARGDRQRAAQELRKAIEADPTDPELYEELARTEIEAGLYDEAFSTIDAALKIWCSPGLLRLLGELHLRRGDTKGAIGAWEKALQVRPGWHELRRELAALRGEDEDFSAPFAIDVKKAISESKTAADYPNADVILVVDQTVDRIYEDGSYSEITHQAQKALTTEGAEQLSHIDVEGELLEVRTHRADGTVLEPAVLPGRGKFTMPGVEIGSVVEYKYRRDHPAPPGGFVVLPSWYFRSLKIPHQVSDYVVIAPKDMSLSITVRNWGAVFPEESFEELPPKEEGPLVTYRWIARNTRPLEPGPDHDHICTLLPHVDIGRPRSWQDLNAELMDLFSGKLRLTDSLKAEAAKVTEGLEGWEAKARAIFRHVNSLVKTEAEHYDANHVLAARAGNRSMLLAALLNAAGLDARMAVARPRPETINPSEGPGEPNWSLLRKEYFRDTLICVMGEGGQKLWLDPEGPYSNFATISPKFQGGIAFIVSPEGGILCSLPWGPLREHGENTQLRLEFDTETGSATGELILTNAGATGAALKQRFAESSASWRRTWAARRLSEAVVGASLTGLELRDLEEHDSPFVLRIAFKLEDALFGKGEWRELPAVLEPLNMVKRFVHQPTREHPQKIVNPLVRWDEIVIRVPHIRQWALPESRSEQTAFASYSLTFYAEGDVLRIKRSVTMMSQIIPPERYKDFVRFARSIDSAEAAPIRVRLPSSAITGAK